MGVFIVSPGFSAERRLHQEVFLSVIYMYNLTVLLYHNFALLQHNNVHISVTATNIGLP